MGADALSIEGWLMRGAIREDDHFYKAPNPQDDPYSNNDWIKDNRPLHHFYDPRNDRGLRVGIKIGQKAPDWGIGADDAFANENDADVWRRNHFTVFDAREAMYRALTGMNKAGSKAIGSGGSTPSNAADKEAVRKAYWATTFRALGDLVHLIQDMAQPQHTRNDPHAGDDNYESEAGPTGHKSFYESYIETRAVQGAVGDSSGNTSTIAALVYDSSPSYPIPRFNNYVSYFSTQHLSSNVSARKGMADYSNRGFFSVGKNLGQGDYDLPSNSITGGSYTPELRPVGTEGATVHILKGSVTDAYANSTATGVPLTAFGAWNDALEQVTSEQSFTLIKENYDAMADLLIPRAVAYSAGLIDYFFRGRMEISLPDEKVYSIIDHAIDNAADAGFKTIKLKLRNATPAIDDGQLQHSQPMSGGTLWAVVKFHRNGCYEPDLSGQPRNGGCDFDAKRGVAEEIVVSKSIDNFTLNPNQVQPLSFDFSESVIPVSARDLFLQVVYRGELGAETDAVVVATKDISEPTFMALSNYTDYYLFEGVFYKHDDPQLRDLVDYDGDNVPDEDINAISLAYNFNFGGTSLGSVVLPPARHSQFAVLVDLPTFQFNLYKQSFGYWATPVVDSYLFQQSTTIMKINASDRGFYTYKNFPDWKVSRNGPLNPTNPNAVLEDFADTSPLQINLNFQ